jgi:hypothetical protein
MIQDQAAAKTAQYIKKRGPIVMAAFSFIAIMVCRIIIATKIVDGTDINHMNTEMKFSIYHPTFLFGGIERI